MEVKVKIPKCSPPAVNSCFPYVCIYTFWIMSINIARGYALGPRNIAATSDKILNIWSESAWCKKGVFCVVTSLIWSATNLYISLTWLCNPYLPMLLKDIILCVEFWRLVSTFKTLYITRQDSAPLNDDAIAIKILGYYC